VPCDQSHFVVAYRDSSGDFSHDCTPFRQTASSLGTIFLALNRLMTFRLDDLSSNAATDIHKKGPHVMRPLFSPFCHKAGRGAAFNRARKALAAATIAISAGSTSFQPRVLRPQSGLTQSCCGDNSPSALSSRASISPCVGTRGLWMS